MMRHEDAWKMIALMLGTSVAAAAVGFGILMLIGMATGHAEGWDTDDPDLASWFATNVVKSCCDQKDAYLADGIDGDGDNIIAVITDGSANFKYSKPAIPNGTRIIVPKASIRINPPVPGGHAVIFLMKELGVAPEKRRVFCYFPKGLY
jgi:hypothetical protein